MKKLLLPFTALALIFSTPSHAQDEGAGGGGFGDFGNDDGGGGMGVDDQSKSSNLIYTKGLTVQTKQPIAIEQFIEILESKDSGIGQKINVFIDAKAAGTLLAPVNVRNVSAWTLLKTIAPHADLEVDIIKSNTPNLEGILEIRGEKTPNIDVDYFNPATKEGDLNPKPSEDPTDKGSSPLEETSQPPKALPGVQSNNAPLRAIPIKTASPQLSVIPLGKLNPLRWRMHIKYLTEILKTQAQIEQDSNCQFNQVGQLLILRQSPEKLKQAELLANAYLASMTEIERQAELQIAPLRTKLHLQYSVLSMLDNETDKKAVQETSREMNRLEELVERIEFEFGLR